MWIWISSSAVHLRLSPTSTLPYLHISFYALALPLSPAIIHFYSLLSFPSFLALKNVLQKLQLPADHIVTHTSLLPHIGLRLARPQKAEHSSPPLAL